MDISKKTRYIAEILSSHKMKISALNKQGYYDEAKFFELLVKDVVTLMIKEKTVNLNDFGINFPGIDLRTESGNMDIQVSTTDKINAKIAHSFKVIKTKKLSVKRLVFVFLSNEEFTSKVKYPPYFNASRDVYNIPKFLNHIKSDVNLINGIYDVFIRFFETGGLLDRFNKVMEKSEYDVQNIASSINYKFIINREQNISYDTKNHMIIGEAGFGKSAFVKNTIKDIPILYARSESFVGKATIDDIWGLDIIGVLKLLKNERFIVFIDSLESIADVHVNNVLSYFMSKMNELPNVNVIFTCRTIDASKFTKLINDNQIKFTELSLLDSKEMDQVLSFFPKLKTINQTTSLYQLIKNPFYLNLLIMYGIDYNNVSNENEFRNYIWQNIIGDTTKKRDVFKNIVLDRSKSFSLYVSKDNYPKEEVDILLSSGILIEFHNQIKSRYDIFEDICFERIIDSYFEQSKSNFTKFFDNIELLGKCIYRRYQIWVGNKLWSKENQLKFVTDIVFSNEESKWIQQTIIGILKSQQGTNFIQQNIDKFKNEKFFTRFLKLMNLYGYTIEQHILFKTLQIKPRVHGRIGLLHIAYKHDYYKNASYFDGILSLLKSNGDIGFASDDQMRTLSFEMIDYMSTQVLDSYIKDDSYSHEYLLSFFDVLYVYSKDDSNIIDDYFDRFLTLFNSKNRHEERIGEKLIEKAIEYSNIYSVVLHPRLICDLAFRYWTSPDKDKGIYRSYYDDELKGTTKYGLNENANNHKMHRKTFLESYFIPFLFIGNFDIALEFTIKLMNHCIEQLKINKPDDVFNTTVFFDDGTSKEYYMDNNLWYAFRGFCVMPEVLIILLKNLEYAVLNQLDKIKEKDDRIMFAKNFKDKVYSKSNNISIFPIIVSIGQKYIESLGDYALDLASNLYFIHMDMHRITHEIGGLFEIGSYSKEQWKLINKHNQQDFRKKMLQEYVLQLQLMGFKDKCFKLIDHHYETIENTPKNANALLQVEKMDIRKAALQNVENGVLIYPGQVLSPYPAKIIQKQQNETKVQNEDSLKLSKIENELKENKIDVNQTIIDLKVIIGNTSKYQISYLYDHRICEIMYNLLEYMKELTNNNLNYVLDYLFSKMLAIFDNSALGCNLNNYDNIFKIDFDLLDINNKQKLEKILFYSFVENNNGLVNKIIVSANRVLNQNVKLLIIHALIKKSLDERKRQLFIYKNQKEIIDFPELDISIYYTDMLARDIALPEIDTLDDMAFNVKSFVDIYRVDFDGSTDWSKKIIRATIKYAFRILSGKQKKYPDVYYWDFQKYLFNNMKKSFENSKTIIDVIVDELDHDMLNYKVSEFLQSVFSYFTLQYYDAYEDNNIRRNIETVIDYFEQSLLQKFGQDKIQIFNKCFILMIP
ncbi:MAG: SMEK domain-containing protein, partial [Acholeplasmataceae bacterium]